jgi:hypothetical protein
VKMPPSNILKLIEENDVELVVGAQDDEND